MTSAEDRFLVLHGLAIKKHGTPEEVVELIGLDLATVKAVLEEAAAGGRAAAAQGKYMLTPAAQMALAAQYPTMFAKQRADAAFASAYEQFERINVDLKGLITDWQVIDVRGQKVPNDHSDKAYDARIIDRLGSFHEGAERIVAALAKGLDRIAIYGRRLTAALEKAEDGDVAWVSDARTSSYHTVWFELHEDLLRIMGRKRQE